MAYPFPEEALLTFESFKELPLVHVHVSCLMPTQYVVRIDRMEWLAAGNKPEGDDIPHCLTWKGVTYLYDGHHRWLLAKLQGVTWMAVRNLVIEFKTNAATPEGHKINPAWVAAGPEADAQFCFHPRAMVVDGREKKDRPWSDYPIGTKAFAIGGGHWIRVKFGWRWRNGSTFPAPGGDASGIVELPKKETSI